MVHYSEGRVLIDNRPFDYDPKHFIHLKEGQRLRTGERGRVELMLVPDVLVRLDSHSEVEMVSSRLADAQIRLLAGSCTVEARRTLAGYAPEVQLPGAKLRFDRSGLYRLIRDLDATSIEVFRGRARISTQQGRYVLKANRIMKLPAGVGEPRIAKLDRVEFVLLDEWARVGDTGERLATVGQRGQATAAVLQSRLPCGSGSSCRVTGLDCVLPRPVNRPIIAFTGPHTGGLPAR
jgi:hypothetical protein